MDEIVTIYGLKSFRTFGTVIWLIFWCKGIFLYWTSSLCTYYVKFSVIRTKKLYPSQGWWVSAILEQKGTESISKAKLVDWKSNNRFISADQQWLLYETNKHKGLCPSQPDCIMLQPPQLPTFKAVAWVELI